jgi:NAD+ synthase
MLIMNFTTDTCITFLRSVFTSTQKTTGIVAVSGGIDSAVSLTLLTKALGPENTYALFLPYGDQSIADSKAIAAWNNLPTDHIFIENIKPTVDQLSTQLHLEKSDHMRKGNLMARSRMIILYDYAKKLDALVVGTENKSEEYLGYFTRFGDAASDIEPIKQFTKTQIRAVSLELGIPETFRTKAPSAGLWEGQSDEQELGFTYEQADQVIEALENNQLESLSLQKEIKEKVLARIHSQHFKHEVPYTIH